VDSSLCAVVGLLRLIELPVSAESNFFIYYFIALEQIKASENYPPIRNDGVVVQSCLNANKMQDGLAMAMVKFDESVPM
jgi:hypothetical protein